MAGWYSITIMQHLIVHHLHQVAAASRAVIVPHTTPGCGRCPRTGMNRVAQHDLAHIPCGAMYNLPRRLYKVGKYPSRCSPSHDYNTSSKQASLVSSLTEFSGRYSSLDMPAWGGVASQVIHRGICCM